MLLESMIRLGRPMVEGGFDPSEVIRQISDIADDRGKGFFEHIFIVELRKGEMKVHPPSIWGHFEKVSEKSKKERFYPDLEKGIVTPFVVPSGGNPLKPQGRYAVPAYLVYDRQLRKFQGSIQEIVTFLGGRIKRTIDLSYDPEIIEKIAEGIHEKVKTIELADNRKNMGLIILVDLDRGRPYFVQNADDPSLEKSATKKFAASLMEKDKEIFADLEAIQELFGLAKAEEGAEKGKKEGNFRCFFCPSQGTVVSAYNKAYPWLTTTWEAPLPLGRGAELLVEGIALCPACYNALTYGSNVFLKLTRTMENWLTKELFAPNTSSKAREHYRSNATVYGGVLALPVLDGFLEDEREKELFIRKVGQLMSDNKQGDKVGLHLNTVTGVETFLPEGLDGDDFRLTLLYFTGDITRSDIHLLACIEDVLPSTAQKLDDYTKEAASYALGVASSFPFEVSDNRKAYISRRYNSLPYLLSFAFGAPYLWSSLESAFHRKYLDGKRFITNCASRFNELSKDLESNNYKIIDEAMFYLSFKHFLNLYHQDLFKMTGGEKVRDWKELLSLAAEEQPENIELDQVEEIGFVIGCVMRRFANHYYYHTRVGDKGKDFIKHRVMTFGSSLTPEVIWKRGLSKVEEIDRLLGMGVADDLRRRVAVLSTLFAKNKELINKNKDEFMAAFWSGYALYPAAKKASEERA